MRAAPALLALLAASSPLAVAGGTTSCEVIPPTFSIGAVGECSVSFVAGPGTMVIGVQSVFGNVGSVEVEGTGPGASRVVVECTLQATAASCFRVLQLVNAAGPWTFRARAQAVNPITFDSWTQLDVTYP